MLLLGLLAACGQQTALHEGSVFLRQEMLRRFLGIDAPLWHIGPYGKPYLSEYPDIDLSVSHTPSLIICALRFPPERLSGSLDGIDFLPASFTLSADKAVFYSLPDDRSGPVGADTEMLRTISPKTISRLAKRCFPDEAPPQEEASTWLLDRWTTLESRCKCSGRGLFYVPEELPSGKLHSSQVSIGGETYLLRVFAGDTEATN